METFRNFSLRPRAVFVFYILMAVIASLQQAYLGPQSFDGSHYTHFNNYIIFKNSFIHLIEGEGLYGYFPNEYFDLYKYSPTFAFFMWPFAYLPHLMGLTLWNLLNTILLFTAIQHLPRLSCRTKSFLSLFIILELLTSVQNSQSNGLMAALMIYSFILFEKRRVFLACFCIAATAYIKLFGIMAILLLILYPNKMKTMAYFALITMAMALLPLFVTSWDQLLAHYQNWYQLLMMDHKSSLGLSVMAVIHKFFGLDHAKISVLIFGLVILNLQLLISVLKKHFKQRLLLLSSIMIWVIIFNHKAESPTFIIAVCGCGLWYFYQKKSLVNTFLVLITYFLSCMSSTEIVPRSIKTAYINEYAIKAIPLILIWIKITWDVLAHEYLSEKVNLMIKKLFEESKLKAYRR